MTYANVVQEIKKMTRRQRVALLKVIADSLVQPERGSAPDSNTLSFSRGALRRMGIPPLTDEEVDEVIAQSLIDKHLR